MCLLCGIDWKASGWLRIWTHFRDTEADLLKLVPRCSDVLWHFGSFSRVVCVQQGQQIYIRPGCRLCASPHLPPWTWQPLIYTNDKSCLSSSTSGGFLGLTWFFRPCSPAALNLLETSGQKKRKAITCRSQNKWVFSLSLPLFPERLAPPSAAPILKHLEPRLQRVTASPCLTPSARCL